MQEACHKLRPAWAREKELDSENKRGKKAYITSSRMLEIGVDLSSFLNFSLCCHSFVLWQSTWRQFMRSEAFNKWKWDFSSLPLLNCFWAPCLTRTPWHGACQVTHLMAEEIENKGPGTSYNKIHPSWPVSSCQKPPPNGCLAMKLQWINSVVVPSLWASHLFL